MDITRKEIFASTVFVTQYVPSHIYLFYSTCEKVVPTQLQQEAHLNSFCWTDIVMSNAVDNMRSKNKQ